MSFDLVFFGGTGDLTWRKLMPALLQAMRHDKLPGGGRILAVARDERSDDDYRHFIHAHFTAAYWVINGINALAQYACNIFIGVDIFGK